MGKKGSSNKKAFSGLQTSFTLREESSGKKKINVKAKSMLKLDHIKRLAIWTTSEASIPSLGAFFGRRLADTAEAMGATLDHSLFPCESCETILHPGRNCTVRIEKIRRKVRRRGKKPVIPTQNNVVYRCHFCSHRNLRKGTPSGHMAELCPQKSKPLVKLELVNSTTQKPDTSENEIITNTEVLKMLEVTLPDSSKDDLTTNNPSTPMQSVITLLEARKKKRTRSHPKKAVESESKSATTDTEHVCTSNKRKRKSWKCLKEIAENSSAKEKSSNFSNMSIPFFL